MHKLLFIITSKKRFLYSNLSNRQKLKNHIIVSNIFRCYIQNTYLPFLPSLKSHQILPKAANIICRASRNFCLRLQYFHQFIKVRTQEEKASIFVTFHRRLRLAATKVTNINAFSSWVHQLLIQHHKYSK